MLFNKIWYFCLLSFLEINAFQDSNRRFIGFSDFNLCSRQIILDSSGYFFSEHGCEGDAVVALGKYIFTDTLLTLNYLPHDSVQIFNKVIYSAPNTDTVITIKGFDRFGNSVDLENVDIYLNAKQKEAFRLFGVIPKSRLDSVASLLFWRLDNLYSIPSKDSIIQIPIKQTSMNIYFNLPEYYFYCNVFRKEDDTNKIEKMILLKDTLYTLDKKPLFFLNK